MNHQSRGRAEGYTRMPDGIFVQSLQPDEWSGSVQGLRAHLMLRDASKCQPHK